MIILIKFLVINEVYQCNDMFGLQSMKHLILISCCCIEKTSRDQRYNMRVDIGGTG